MALANMKSVQEAATSPTMYLTEILAHTRRVVAERKQAADMGALERLAAGHEPRGFARALRMRAEHGVVIIAELKKASPSRGIIRPDFDAAALAAQMEADGAATLSVLTDERFFQGSLENLQRASAAVSIPCLRKDFMVDEFQMLEARAHGADAVLLIVAALDDATLRSLRLSAKAHHLDVLCEVHDAEELDRARDLGCECVGVNSRDLRTFEVSLERACELAARLPGDAVKVAESGIHTVADMQKLRAAGYEAFLIGESLMRQPQPGEALARLLHDAGGRRRMFVKICATTNLADAQLAAELGADAIGFVFAPSKRQVTAEQVREITRALPPTLSKVGVFTTADAEQILQAARVAGLDTVQLHSAFDPKLVETIHTGSGGMLRVLQVVDVGSDTDLEHLRTTLKAVLQRADVAAALLDASHGGASGGTGLRFDWERTSATVRRVQQETGGRVIVAGGLHAGNVGEAIAAFAPWGVDVASGVEAQPGTKDAARLRSFLERARADAR